MPKLLGTAFSSAVVASKPPAEAPIPTTGNLLLPWDLDRSVSRCSAGVVPFSFIGASAPDFTGTALYYATSRHPARVFIPPTSPRSSGTRRWLLPAEHTFSSCPGLSAGWSVQVRGWHGAVSPMRELVRWWEWL